MSIILAQVNRRVMSFPGRPITVGEPDSELVRRLQRRLNDRGCGPLDVDGIFGPGTRSAVKLFQARFPDIDGQPLRIDGVVGAITWAALFGAGEAVIVAQEAAFELRGAALAAAQAQIGVREDPPGSNAGRDVAAYLDAVGLPPGNAWCAAFVYWCFTRAAAVLGCDNPVPRTGGVLQQWRRAVARGVPHVEAKAAADNPVLVLPGSVFYLSTGGGMGHTGFVEEVQSGKLVTIEGNTNDSGSREGVGVFRRTGRKVKCVSLGFVVYGDGW
jgi:hypothetical protein